MPIQVICNFHKDPIKTKQTMLRARSYGGGGGGGAGVAGVFGTKWQVTPKVNIPIWLEF